MWRRGGLAPARCARRLILRQKREDSEQGAERRGSNVKCQHCCTFRIRSGKRKTPRDKNGMQKKECGVSRPQSQEKKAGREKRRKKRSLILKIATFGPCVCRNRQGQLRERGGTRKVEMHPAQSAHILSAAGQTALLPNWPWTLISLFSQSQFSHVMVWSDNVMWKIKRRTKREARTSTDLLSCAKISLCWTSYKSRPILAIYLCRKN